MTSTLKKIPLSILENVDKTISKYKLLTLNQEIIVAFSGGKDSLFTMLVLREMGYKIQPAIVDMGYEVGWGERIRAIANNLGFNNAEVLSARDQAIKKTMSEQTFKKISTNIEVLNNNQLFTTQVLTPCTFCYNTKAILLENFANKTGINTIVFGQHALDAIASFLKSAFMYIDRWDYQNETFSHKRYSQLVDNLLSEFTQSYENVKKSIIMDRLSSLATKHHAATDDPPIQKLGATSNNIQLVRPLFDIRESDIISYITQNALLTEGSGCGHGATKETQTPREMIYFRILRILDSEIDDDRLIKMLMEFVYLGLTDEGKLFVNVRNQRERILGAKYKGSESCSTVKE